MASSWIASVLRSVSPLTQAQPELATPGKGPAGQSHLANDLMLRGGKSGTSELIEANPLHPKVTSPGTNGPLCLIWLPVDSSSTRGGEIGLSREAAPDCWEAPHPPPPPHQDAHSSCPSPSHMGLSVPRAAAQHREPASQYPPLVGVTEGEGARPGAHNILSTFMVDWEMGGKKKKDPVQQEAPPHTHFAMEGADTPNCRPPERSGSKTMVHISASPYFVFWTRVQWLSLPWAKAMVRQALIHSLFPPLCPRPSLLFLNFYLFIYL